MDIFLDLEKTLLKDDNSISEAAKQKLAEIAGKHRVYILTYTSIKQVRKLLPHPAITILSVVENCSDPESNIAPLPASVVDKLLQNPYVFSMHYITDSLCTVYKYQERLKKLYAAPTLRLANAEETYAVLFACFKEGLAEIQQHLPNVHIEILAEDARKLFCKASLFPSTKKAFVQRLKKSPAIGIGDSFEDYEFIQECETQVAMKNADADLKRLCKYQTEKTNNADGAIEYLLNFLKHQQA